VFVPFAFVVAVIVTTTWARIERRRSVHNPARLVYLGSTAVLLVVLAVEPVVGFVGYVGAHAAEYLLVVRWRIGRAAERATVGDRVGAVARRIGSDGTIALYAAAVVALIVALRGFDGSDVTGAPSRCRWVGCTCSSTVSSGDPRRAANEATVPTKTSADDVTRRRRGLGAALSAGPVAR
jgi:hypothetical protein